MDPRRHRSSPRQFRYIIEKMEQGHAAEGVYLFPDEGPVVARRVDTISGETGYAVEAANEQSLATPEMWSALVLLATYGREIPHNQLDNRGDLQ